MKLVIRIAAIFLLAVMAGPSPRAVGSPSSTTLTDLQDQSAPQESRDLAAQRLAATHDPVAKSALLDLLMRGDHGGQLAVARALAGGAWPDPDFIEPLSALLFGREPASVAAAAAALAQYSSNTDVLKRLIIVATSSQDDKIRIPVIRSIGAFGQKLAAQTLIDFQAHDPDVSVAAASADALTNMTGLYDLGHDSLKWQQWWDKNAALSDADFQAQLLTQRGQSFPTAVAQREQSQESVIRVLIDLYNQAPPTQRPDLLLRFLRSFDAKIRALGASMVWDSRGDPAGASPDALKEVRGLLSDVSADVRAEAAHALYSDPDSTVAMDVQLDHEPDELVRVELIHSLAPLHDRTAVVTMLRLLGTDPAMRVRAEAADGIRRSADLVNKDPALKSQAVDQLSKLLNGPAANVPSLRQAVVAALAEMRDASLRPLFLVLLDVHETLPVRVNALRGLGNLPDPTPVGDQIAAFLDDDNPEIRRAAASALDNFPKPLPLYLRKLLDHAINDGDASVRDETWHVLLTWMQSPDMEERDLATIADGLKGIDPAKRVIAMQHLLARLQADAQNSPDEAARLQAARDAAVQAQAVGDVLLDPAVNQPAQAGDVYTSALRYWKANQGTPEEIETLSGDVAQALLAAKKWDAAGDFAAGVIKDAHADMSLSLSEESVSRQFKLEAEKLVNSDDPAALDDAEGFFAAIAKMNPPLQGSYPAQLEALQDQIQKKKARRTSAP